MCWSRSALRRRLGAAHRHAVHAGVHAGARVRAQRRAPPRRRAIRAELQADLPERDELPLPVARAARRRRRAAPRLLRRLNGRRSTKRALADGLGELHALPPRLVRAARRPATWPDAPPPPRTHCDGSPLLRTPPGRSSSRRWCGSTRARAADAIDWNADGDLADTPAYLQDINFNGRLDGVDNGEPLLPGSDDWTALRLESDRQPPQCRRPVSHSRHQPLRGGPAVAVDVGKGDLGKGDLGKGDLGKGDLGKGDLGKGDLGKGDLGKGDLGKGDLGKGDLGGGDLFEGDPRNPGGELDFETATDLARTPPNAFTACVVGVGTCAAPAAQLHDVAATWTIPHVGGVAQFTLYRVDGPTLVPGQTWTMVTQSPVVIGQQSYAALDTSELVDDAFYTYFAVATYADGIQSDPSNLVTIRAVNDPPVADDDTYPATEDTRLDVPAPGVLANDADPDSPITLTAELVTAPAHGTLALATDGSFAYTPAADYFGTDSFTYRAVSGAVTTNVATVTITVAAVNDAPATFDIPDVTIDQDTSTLALGFTIADENPATVTLGGLSSDTTLVPLAGVVFGGSGAARTVTVTPAAGRSGTATIGVTAIDEGGLATTDTFVLTVRATAAYTFVSVQNAPPPSNKTFKAGSAVPMKWYFANGTTPVDSSQVTHVVTVRGPLPNGPVVTISNTDPGGSSFRYDAPGKTWYFNLQTKDAAGKSYVPGTYEVIITPSDPRYRPSAPFLLKLVK